MRSVIIFNEEQQQEVFCDELRRFDKRKHHMDVSISNVHCGRITSIELYHLTFSGKFNFSGSI